jgi:hypothetical protein
VLRAALTLWTCITGLTGAGAGEARTVLLRGADGVEAVFAREESGGRWVAVRDAKANRTWPILGPRLRIEIVGGDSAQFEDAGFGSLVVAKRQVTLTTTLPALGLDVKPDLKRSAQKDLQDAQTQFPSFSFSSLPSVGRTEGNEGNREQRRGI